MPVGSVAVDDAREARLGERDEVLAGLDPDPAPAHLVRDGRGRAAAEERIEHPVAGVGRHREDARDEALGLLVAREDDAALARDPLERDVVPHVGERLDDRGRAVDLADLVARGRGCDCRRAR